jgi:hypothetical protein
MASLKRGNGRAVPLGLRDRPPNTHARVVRRIGPEPDGGCGQPSTGRERTLAGLSLPLVPRTVSVSETGVSRQIPHASARGIARFAHGHVGAGGIDDRRHGRRRSRAVPTRSRSGSGMTRRLSAVEEFSLIADADVEGQQDRRGSVDRHGRGVFGERNPGVSGDRESRRRAAPCPRASRWRLRHPVRIPNKYYLNGGSPSAPCAERDVSALPSLSS